MLNMLRKIVQEVNVAKDLKAALGIIVLRVREAMNTAGFVDSYRAYLNIRGKSTEDPLVPDVRRRAGAAQ